MRSRLVLAVGLLWSGTGCIHLHVSAGRGRLVEMHGLARAHVALTHLMPYRGRILDLETFEGDDLVALELWPLADLGVGFVGVRAKLLYLDAGAGILGYDARLAGQPVGEEGEGEDLQPRHRDQPPAGGGDAPGAGGDGSS